MEIFSTLLAIFAGNSPGTGEFPAQRPVTRSFDVFFDLRPNKQLSKQWWGWWFETPSWSLWRHRNDQDNTLRWNVASRNSVTLFPLMAFHLFSSKTLPETTLWTRVIKIRMKIQRISFKKMRLTQVTAILLTHNNFKLFFLWNCLLLIQIQSLFLMVQLNWFSVGTYIDFTPNRRQAIIWTNEGLLYRYPRHVPVVQNPKMIYQYWIRESYNVESEIGG